jgi:D-2-hydroxyacid dehydrogenase (NADP+)
MLAGSSLRASPPAKPAVIAIGQIGESLARKARALGMRVVGISSGARHVAGFDQIFPRERLLDVVRELDYLVVLTPYSADTHHIVAADVLAAMKPEAFLVNVARGGVVNEPDLVAALRAGRIAGAALDVFQEEPLPPADPLWSLPNVIISPHLAGLNSSYAKSVLPLVIRNIELFRAGRFAEMHNRIARGQG